MANGILFLNTPIESEDEDIIGIGAQVNRLAAAIDSDSQMIAVTSPFGSGKTSLVELLQEERRNAKKESCILKRLFCERERIVKISMWSQLQGKGELTSIDLHRTFLSQLINQVKPKRAEYVKNALNPNNGIFALHTNKPIFWMLTIVTLLFVITAWGLNTFPDIIKSFLPQVVMDHASIISTICFFAAIVLAIVLLTRARILYSFKSPENGREIGVDEIIDLYRAEILQPQNWLLYHLNRLFGFLSSRYIVVIEDLDRTTNPAAIISFLTELRKYCCSESTPHNRNKVNFIVNIKPESILKNHDEDNDSELLYEKIFDFILNLQTVNIDNYDAILEGLLKSKEAELAALGFQIDPDRIVGSINGMQWIIREKCNGIREIKDRLNTAFALYESLTSKFEDATISFETCAAVAYLTTAFSSDLYSLSGNEFDELVDLYIQKPSADYHICDTILSESSEPFRMTVWQMIQAQIIDSSYRSYFYSYPKGSKLYNSEERKIIDTILYNAKIPDLDAAITNNRNTQSSALQDAFDKAMQLGILLPNQVLESEPLYIETVRLYPKGLLDKLSSLDYSKDGADRTLQTYKRLLSYDKERTVYSSNLAEAFCDLWESNFNEEFPIVQIRDYICQELGCEVHWYRSLFFDPHALITQAEMDHLEYLDIFDLINYQAKGFSALFAEYIQKRFLLERETNAEVVTATYAFFYKSLIILGAEKIGDLLLEFMLSSNHIYPDFEAKIVDLINNYNNTNGEHLTGMVLNEAETTLDAETAGNWIYKYKELVNQVAIDHDLSSQTLRYIQEIGQFDRYSIEVANQLRTNGYYWEYIFISLIEDFDIPLGDEDIIESIKSDYSNILISHEGFFLKLRKYILCDNNTPISTYTFLFGADCPIMSQDEFSHAIRRSDVNEATIISLIPPSLVKESDTRMLCEYFCKHKQVSYSFEILNYISKFDSSVAKVSFMQLDFDMIRYRYISKSSRNTIKQRFKTAMELDTTEGKLTFMEHTKFLEDAWEKEIAVDLKGNADLLERYIGVVNSCEKITGTTVRIICENSFYPMSPIVTDRLFAAKKYTAYVSAKTGWDKTFTMESGARGEELWPVYLKIFSSEGHKRTRNYMVKNLAFLERIRDERAYSGLSEENMLQMAGVFQDKQCIAFVSENYSEEYMLKYFCQISGFKDRAAAEAFLDVVKVHETLKLSDELYHHTYEMLIDGPLKGFYTRMRNKS